MVSPLTSTCHHLNANQLQKIPWSYSENYCIPCELPLNVNVIQVTKKPDSSLVCVLFHHKQGSVLQEPEGGGQCEHQSLPTPSKLEGLCRIFLCCHNSQDREEIAIQFNCIFMSFHGDAWTKKNQPCSYCSQLPVSWETVVEVYGEEQEVTDISLLSGTANLYRVM